MPRAGLSPERVLELGAEVADERGFDAVTVTAVAQCAGVRVASLYAHVDGSAALRTGVARRALDELADAGDRAVAGVSGREALLALAEAYRSYAATHPGRYAATQARVDPDEPYLVAARRHADLARAVLRGYRLTPTDQTHAVRLLGSLVAGFLLLEAGGGFDHSRPSARASWLRGLDALDATFTAWGRAD